ncbi:hypothetical protein chiPu_0025990 [Chiloscyllium punctatum]|uniref:Uncharacterized protein n=1 Tax=Chiloscyllium punctatum TaxID=137246 RepID=A0A401THH1_CHIPU|nr:hypothetical protein [Chiloscyllium punctatum]
MTPGSGACSLSMGRVPGSLGMSAGRGQETCPGEYWVDPTERGRGPESRGRVRLLRGDERGGVGGAGTGLQRRFGICHLPGFTPPLDQPQRRKGLTSRVSATTGRVQFVARTISAGPLPFSVRRGRPSVSAAPPSLTRGDDTETARAALGGGAVAAAPPSAGGLKCSAAVRLCIEG